MIVAFGQYSKLFQFFQKTPKTYRAVVWLGAVSDSLDIENVVSIKEENKLDVNNIKNELKSLEKEIEYYPPKFSAKKIDGERAYNLAREGKDVEMKKSVMKVYNTKFISYNHPFITFEASVSEGSYIRSLAQILLDNLGRVGTLSYLNRLNEGKFFYENEKDLNPLDYLDIEEISYKGDKSYFEQGKKILIEYLDKKDDGKYLVKFDDFFSIIEIENSEVKYILNRVMI